MTERIDGLVVSLAIRSKIDNALDTLFGKSCKILTMQLSGGKIICIKLS